MKKKYHPNLDEAVKCIVGECNHGEDDEHSGITH